MERKNISERNGKDFGELVGIKREMRKIKNGDCEGENKGRVIWSEKWRNLLKIEMGKDEK